MTISQTDIFNMALSAAQEKATISDPNEDTKLGKLCRLWYPIARRRLLKAGAWPCATSYARLAVLSERGNTDVWESTDPAPGYQYAYGLPDTMLAPQRLHNWMPFERVFANGLPTLVTNAEDAVLRYTFDQESTAYWDDGLVLAVSAFLAALLSKNINGKLGLYDRLVQEADGYAAVARMEIANEEEVTQEALPGNIVARGYGGTPTQTRYYYPFETLNGVAE